MSADEDPNQDVRPQVAERTALFAAAAIDPGYFAEHFGRWVVEWEEGVAEKVLEMSADIITSHPYAGFGYPLAQWVEARQSIGLKP